MSDAFIGGFLAGQKAAAATEKAAEAPGQGDGPGDGQARERARRRPGSCRRRHPEPGRIAAVTGHEASVAEPMPQPDLDDAIRRAMSSRGLLGGEGAPALDN